MIKKGYRFSSKARQKMSQSHIGLHIGSKNGMYGKHLPSWNKGLTKETDVRVLKHSKDLMGHLSTDSMCTHHRDFDHQNDLSGNRKKITRKEHANIHSNAGRRAIIFVKNALDKGIITRTFYEDFLVYVNQEEKNLPEIQTIAEEETSEMIN